MAATGGANVSSEDEVMNPNVATLEEKFFKKNKKEEIQPSHEPRQSVLGHHYHGWWIDALAGC